MAIVRHPGIEVAFCFLLYGTKKNAVCVVSSEMK